MSHLLAPERVRVPLQAGDKEGILLELVELLATSCGLGSQRDDLYGAVLERERVLSTGIGDGVALPHAKFAGLAELAMAAGVSREPLDFGALDGRPVQLLFLIVAPETATGAHVRVLARISRLMRDGALRDRLCSAEDEKAFIDALAAAEHAT
ncbi:MAG: PTS sugar transporter subunit IIA [Gemmatimonadetes bacterium]|uniref:PTS sugar transporter subunit IIA n=1 Tax=Candidatus Kutchimonas denitrificans TaxID=3056748 RepID=A0AAE4Z6D1_9BACT|nr:PTS sugar transporter subunit IIA [Gemmatimonadota bacterium]NIR74615.1 PTS sugar transporter subunit IIA [Candidatus Kutchimonas denitrificans]NIS02805.1 PTS sugar transporter subunit IIA [Gemmatimonadota bacterium]NIT68966.1 PTS sugar transporter subunit IIA [Gemmatimonadota bacterium]NIU52271.1 PTS transporter subunit EIIA [Gemmatimonadota bacterium]